LHQLGWKAFQDLCIALAEERLQRPVQTFLPTNDAGRDGAFLGTWDTIDGKESTIQCKFTSKQDHNLTLSMLSDELPKAKRLAKRGLADDYIILTNHTVTGESELRIRDAFEAAGVGRCRVFHRDWIIERIRESGRLRMMVPRLYGLVDLADIILDDRAYQQAQLILSEMSDNLQKLVVTEAHRKSVRAVSQHNLVLLLGSPAAGKSTIGASLALGASDIWKCRTIKSTSPEHLQSHLDASGGQFFWIDDAWGTTQYQRERTESWNQVFPLIQGAMRRGTRFLFTSRDYIWQSARKDLKLQALPVLMKSQVIINVQELTVEEKARILYNHIKLGDQAPEFRQLIKPILPSIAKRSDFLPESARRLGTKLFTEHLSPTAIGVNNFFEHPMDFLKQTIQNLAPECQGAIALIFLNGGKVRSPVSNSMLAQPAEAFGVAPPLIRRELEALNGGLLNLARDEEGPFWTYRHPTISDAFASNVARSPELIEIYLQGAKAESIAYEVVCAGIQIRGASVVVPNSLHEMLAHRIKNLSRDRLRSFVSYRANREFASRLIQLRPDLWDLLEVHLFRPLKDDSDVRLLTALHKFGLIDEQRRRRFVEEVRAAAVEEADASFLENEDIASVLTDAERESILEDVDAEVLDCLDAHIERLRRNWDHDYEPNEHFNEFRNSIHRFAEALEDHVDYLDESIEWRIRPVVQMMEEYYVPNSITEEPAQQSPAKTDSLDGLFRDVDE
jgi:hypothetical protein